MSSIILNDKQRSESVSELGTESVSNTTMLETSEHGYMMITFTSSLKTHSIKVEVDLSEKEILINTMNVQPKSPGELVLMLKKMVFEMKKLNILHVVQQVTSDDWYHIIKPQNIFHFVNENKQYGFITIKCTIERFPEAVMSALGFDAINSSSNIKTIES